MFSPSDEHEIGETETRRMVDPEPDGNCRQRPECFKCGQPPASGTKLLLCGGCMTAKYCTSRCQKDDRPQHKLVCKVLGEERDNAVLSLVVAAGRGDLAKVRSLLVAGSKVDKTKGEKRITALYAAADYGCRCGCTVALVTELLGAGARVDKTVAGGGTPLIAATRKGNTVVVDLLLRAGADANMGDGQIFKPHILHP